MTASYKADNDNALPPAELIGSSHVKFPSLVGRGSTRTVSDPVEPQYLGAQPYVQIDMGIDGKRFPEMRKGLMNLFGTDVAIDRRALVGFLRDISLVSEEEYQAFKPPSEIAVFSYNRNDLRDNPQLEYSGIYEDGWVSENSVYKLTQQSGASQMVVKGEVPTLPGGDPYFETRAQLFVDGKLVAEQMLPLGAFELRGNVAPAEASEATASAGAAAVRKVELKFSRYRNLPMVDGYPDGRPVSAMLKYVGFQGGQAPAAAPAVAQNASR
jgi:hypothetical protein